MLRCAASNCSKGLIKRSALPSTVPASASPSVLRSASHHRHAFPQVDQHSITLSRQSFATSTISTPSSSRRNETIHLESCQQLPPLCRDDREDGSISSTSSANLIHHGSNDTRRRQSLRHASSLILDGPHVSRQNSSIIARHYHATSANERAVAIVLSLGAVAATAKAGQYTLRAYDEWKASLPEEEEQPVEKMEDDKSTAGKAKDQGDSKASGDAAPGGASGAKTNASGGDGKAKEKTGKRENIFSKFFNMSVGSKYYEGGFEDEMTRREAALILGVRESSSPKRIKEAHRNLLILNHPDTGGSNYISGKINEAKELLLKGKRRM